MSREECNISRRRTFSAEFKAKAVLKALIGQKSNGDLPPDLLTSIDRLARLRDISRSQMICEALAALQSAEEESLAAAGYRFYADEASAFAEACLAQK